VEIRFDIFTFCTASETQHRIIVEFELVESLD
jgi:hypothetical protein